MNVGRFSSQIEYIVALEKLNSISRRTYVSNGTRRENSAEHSWHCSAIALALKSNFPVSSDPAKVIELCIIHDVVEVLAGDNSIFDRGVDWREVEELEAKAATSIFGKLNVDDAKRLNDLWTEFREQTTIESQIALAIDRVQPIIQNLHSTRTSWEEIGVGYSDIEQKSSEIISRHFPELWRELSVLLKKKFGGGLNGGQPEDRGA